MSFFRELSTGSDFFSKLQAHFEAGEDVRAFDLLHREWGYMLYTNLSVQSTLLEGFTANGSLSYVPIIICLESFRQLSNPFIDIVHIADTTTTPHTPHMHTAGLPVQHLP